MKKYTRGVNFAMTLAVVTFFARLIVDFIDFKFFRPEIYVENSAPWYTASMIYGGLASAVISVCLIAKLILKDRDRRKSE